MNQGRTTGFFALFCVGAGLALGSWVCIRMSPRSVGLAVFILSPWLLAAALLPMQRRSVGFAVGCSLMILFELFSYIQTFLRPVSSTASLIYIVKPFWQILFCLPIGFLLAWLRGRLLGPRDRG